MQIQLFLPLFNHRLAMSSSSAIANPDFLMGPCFRPLEVTCQRFTFKTPFSTSLNITGYVFPKGDLARVLVAFVPMTANCISRSEELRVVRKGRKENALFLRFGITASCG